MKTTTDDWLGWINWLPLGLGAVAVYGLVMMAWV